VDSTSRTEWYRTRLTIYMRGCPYRSRARRKEPKTRLLVHSGNRFGPNETWLCSRAFHFEPLPRIVAQEPLRHLTAGRISGAEYQNSFFSHVHLTCSAGNQCRVRLHAAQTESITGTSTKTPVARAAPDCGPNNAIAVATANSKKFEAPMSAPGAATECSTLSHFIRPKASSGIHAHDDLSESWVFKGGTCLKKCFFETYRFSEDLDFTLRDEAQLDENFLQEALQEVVARVTDQSGLTIPPDQLEFDIYGSSRQQGLSVSVAAADGPTTPSGRGDGCSRIDRTLN
jgi:Nucleotidyl transferase AbiEii toxin, Type IV TA system